jgi:DNA-binding GntR family transcriptional regulator
MAKTAEQVASVLADRIADGTYPPGSAAPSSGDLSTEFGIAPGTARRALALLEARALMVGGGQGRRRRIAVAVPFTSAIDRIRADMGSGTYPPGTQLPGETELAEATGLSRYAIRQALSELERSGEVVNRPGRRRTVAGGPQSADARYEQIRDALRGDVEQGRLAAGQRVPSEAELGRRFAASRVTVRRALADLEDAGVLAKDPVGRRIVCGPVPPGLELPGSES